MYASAAFFTGRYARPAGHPVCAGDGTRVTSRVFTAPRWPLATSDCTHTGDITVLSEPSLVNQYRRRQNRRSVKWDVTARGVSVQTSITYRPVKTLRVKLYSFVRFLRYVRVTSSETA